MEDSKKSRLEAALYLSEEPIDSEEIADVLDLGSMGYVDMLIDEFKDELDDEGRGLELVETPEGYELKVKNHHLEHVSHLAPHQDLNEGQLRTLSLIAYNSPLEQANLVEVRGNRAYQHVKELVNRGFVSKEKDGRTAILDITDHFLDYFDMDSVDEFKGQFDQDMGFEVEESEEEKDEEEEESEEDVKAEKEDDNENGPEEVEDLESEDTDEEDEESEREDPMDFDDGKSDGDDEEDPEQAETGEGEEEDWDIEPKEGEITAEVDEEDTVSEEETAGEEAEEEE